MKIGDRVLITTQNWFYAPDGRQYRAAVGIVKEIASSEKTLGVETNKNSTNWYVRIGNMLIAGCQIFYVIKTDECNTEDYLEVTTSEDKVISNKLPSHIYDAGD